MLIFKFSVISGRFEPAGMSIPAEGSREVFHPHVDVSFRDGHFVVRMDLPGVSPENLSIEAGENEISITGAVPPPTRPGPCRLMERSSGVFRRSIAFPGKIESDKVEAHLASGVLTLKVPSMEVDSDPTRIEVRIEGAD